MNAQKFTQKSLEAVEAAQTIATEHDNMNLDEEHLLLARMKLAVSARTVLKNGMDLLGVTAPEEMEQLEKSEE